MFQYSMTDLLKNSYKDFHARGLDYLCLHRADALTVKLYLLDGDASQVPEVVNPHDHRYQFDTQVLAGRMLDHQYVRSDMKGSRIYQAFDYMTPLNGGDGFTFRGEEGMRMIRSVSLEQGQMLASDQKKIHTIQMLADQTMLLLKQGPDSVPIGEPTSCWVKKGHPTPDTSGLYTRFTEDDVLNRLALVSQKTGIAFRNTDDL